MRKRVFRTTAYILIAVLAAGMLTGCDLVPSLQITDEQRSLIAEYAAGKLLEYAKGHPGGLMLVEDMDLSEVNPGMKKEEEEPQLPALPEPLPAPGEATDEPLADPGIAPPPEADALVEAPDESAPVATKTVAEALGINGAILTYDRYEKVMTYPNDESELAFTMKAAPGKELLIVHFALTNPGDSDIDVHTDSSNFKVRLLINGGEKLRGDVTFLDNDLMNYSGNLGPGADVDAVLVFEVKEGTEVSSMDLLIVEDDGEQEYKIL